jgi:hypothetical protein
MDKSVQTFNELLHLASKIEVDLDIADYEFSHGEEPKNEWGIWTLRNEATGELIEKHNWLVNVIENLEPGIYEILP